MSTFRFYVAQLFRCLLNISSVCLLALVVALLLLLLLLLLFLLVVVVVVVDDVLLLSRPFHLLILFINYSGQTILSTMEADELSRMTTRPRLTPHTGSGSGFGSGSGSTHTPSAGFEDSYGYGYGSGSGSGKPKRSTAGKNKSLTFNTGGVYRSTTQ